MFHRPVGSDLVDNFADGVALRRNAPAKTFRAALTAVEKTVERLSHRVGHAVPAVIATWPADAVSPRVDVVAD